MHRNQWPRYETVRSLYIFCVSAPLYSVIRWRGELWKDTDAKGHDHSTKVLKLNHAPHLKVVNITFHRANFGKGFWQVQSPKWCMCNRHAPCAVGPFEAPPALLWEEKLLLRVFTGLSIRYNFPLQLSFWCMWLSVRGIIHADDSLVSVAAEDACSVAAEDACGIIHVHDSLVSVATEDACGIIHAHDSLVSVAAEDAVRHYSCSWFTG